MQAIRQHKLIQLWLAATFVILIGAGFVLRPDRDAVQYLKHQDVEIYPSDLQIRQLVTHIRLLQGNEFSLDQIKEHLLSTRSLTNEAVNRMVEHKTVISAKQHAEERLALFAAIALVPPLIVLELGAALFWLRRRYTGWLSAHRPGPNSTKVSR